MATNLPGVRIVITCLDFFQTATEALFCRQMSYQRFLKHLPTCDSLAQLYWSKVPELKAKIESLMADLRLVRRETSAYDEDGKMKLRWKRDMITY
jgi:hypothetical protein